MGTVTFTQLRNHAKAYFDQVEKGESLEIIRKGKPVAVIMPAYSFLRDRWKRANPLNIHGLSFSKALIEDRRASR